MEGVEKYVYYIFYLTVKFILCDYGFDLFEEYYYSAGVPKYLEGNRTFAIGIFTAWVGFDYGLLGLDFFSETFLNERPLFNEFFDSGYDMYYFNFPWFFDAVYDNQGNLVKKDPSFDDQIILHKKYVYYVKAGVLLGATAVVTGTLCYGIFLLGVS